MWYKSGKIYEKINSDKVIDNYSDIHIKLGRDTKLKRNTQRRIKCMNKNNNNTEEFEKEFFYEKFENDLKEIKDEMNKFKLSDEFKTKLKERMDAEFNKDNNEILK